MAQGAAVSNRFFGTDGIRGRVGEEPITPQTVLKLGWAAGRVLGSNGSGRNKVIIGKDTRVSGYLLESALEAGLSAAGMDIALLGPMPTPGIAYLTRTARARAGIVISASHNHFEDNGIKFFSPDGTKLPDEQEAAIEAAMSEPLKTVGSSELGKAERVPDAAGRYIEFCKSTVPHRLSLKGMTVVVDCANGAAYHVAPNVFAEMGADVVAVANRPDGFNINLDCGSTHPGMLQQQVVEHRADVGIALDGDGDRVILVDAQGNCVDGDQILYCLAMGKLQRTELRGGLVGTLMSNFGLERACAMHGIPFLRAQVGDRHVMALLRREGWELGGEASGHIICLDRSTTGDGIIAALGVLMEMVATGRPLADLVAGMEIFPQTLINVRLADRSNGAAPVDLTRNEAVCRVLDRARGELADDGRVVVRASGTEPLIRVMVEGRDSGEVARIGGYIADAVRSAAGSP